MATFEVGTGYKKTSWCSAEIICHGDCPQFTDSGVGVAVYHLYNVAECNYISKSSLVIDIRYKGTTEWESWANYTMGGYEGFTYYYIEIDGGIGFEFRATYKGITKYYSIVAPCVPDWQCEIPLNGFEEDGCGNRRENIDCVCVPDWQCEVGETGYETDINNCGEPNRYNEDCIPCISTDLLPCFPSPGSETLISKPGYYKGYFCATCPGTGKTFDYVPPVNWSVVSCVEIPGWGTHGCCSNCIVVLVELQYIDPCEDVDCPDICVGTNLYSQKCNLDTGECIPDQLLESDSISCSIPTDEDAVNKYLVLGALGIAGYLMLMKNKK